MKTIMLVILVSFAFIPAIAQQTHFKWKGTLNLDSPTDIILDFTNDICDAIRIADSQSLETMHYTLSDTLLTLQKIIPAAANVTPAALVNTRSKER